MAIDINILNAQLSIGIKNANLSQITEKAAAVAGQSSTQLETTIKDAGQVVNGIKGLSQAADNPNATVVSAEDAVCEITGDVPGLAAELIGDVSSVTSDVNAITGNSAAVNGKLNLTISSGAPEAIAKSLKSVTGKTPNEIQNVLKDLAPEGSARDAVANIETALTDGIAGATGLKDATDLFKNAAEDLIKSKFGGIVNGVIRTIDTQFDRVIDDLISDIPINVNLNIDFGGIDNRIDIPFKERIMLLIAEGRQADAIRIIDQVSPKATALIEEKILPLDLSPPKNISTGAPASVGSKTTPCYDIGSNNNNWQGRNTPISPNLFTYIDSPEELVAEFRNTSREITEFIAHWAGTYNNQDIGAEEIHNWHLDRGWSGCGYHYVIRRDGRLQRGRPLERKGAHSGAYGHNNYSIGITFVAGYNCPTGTPTPNRYISAESITSAQMKTFKMWVKAFYDVWPGGQALGHNDTSDKGKVDPGFNVPEYVKITFNKTNVLTTPRKGPLSPNELTVAQLAASDSF